jgi:hypothetical protein
MPGSSLMWKLLTYHSLSNAARLTPHGYKTCYGNAPTFPVLTFPSNDRGSHGSMKCRELI